MFYSTREMLARLEDGAWLLSEDRGNTLMGARQGHHVTPYGFFKETLRNLEGDEPGVMLRQMAHYIDNIDHSAHIYKGLFPNKAGQDANFISEASYNDHLSEQRARITQMWTHLDLETRKFHSDLKISQLSAPHEGSDKQMIIEALQQQNKHHFESIVTYMANTFLEVRNKQIYASFAQIGSPDPDSGESTNIKAAIKYLSAVNKKLANMEEGGVSSVIDNRTGGANAIVLQDFSDKAKKAKLEVLERLLSVPPKKGAVVTNPLDDIVSHVMNTFFYPKVLTGIVDLNTQAGKDAWEANKSKYNKMTRPRTNDEDLLSYVANMHLYTLKTAYPQLNRWPLNEYIDDKFVKAIGESWRLDDGGILKLTERISLFSDEDLLSPAVQDSTVELNSVGSSSENEYAPSDDNGYDTASPGFPTLSDHASDEEPSEPNLETADSTEQNEDTSSDNLDSLSDRLNNLLQVGYPIAKKESITPKPIINLKKANDERLIRLIDREKKKTLDNGNDATTQKRSKLDK